ncbi:xanthine dehydrogenase family protein molybdopterin-binding subunit [Alteromonas gilva]|uniref:Molybdopterin-dependent oxidoreductase n=1 Tax=Alteromonas gilva TaxID=2987522 RepID=A0ABT5L0Z4_9ALTE|nr:molybdopterin cofactor-binding domain-containing protein [Alteromonas gilva]MDC8830716.1 molybdopterin-dependent oxidoreductase [Alteromonas gilva]
MSNNTLSQSRRAFLKRSITASGFTLSLSLLPGTQARAMFADGASESGFTPNVFIHFADNGDVEITCHRSEMGQQIRTSVPQLIVEELGADWQYVTINQATGDAKYGDQNTDGSRSIRRNFKRLREAGAAAALMLCTAAAKGWKVAPDECYTEAHHVVHRPSGRRVPFAEVVSVAAGLTLPDTSKLKLKPRQNWNQIGKAVPSVDLKDMTNGNAVYGQDVVLDDMCFAVIQRPPVLFGKVKSSNQDEVKNMAGVIDVINLPEASAPALFNPLGGIAVLASNTWLAWQGVNALKTEWHNGTNASYNSDTYQQSLLEEASKPGEVVRKLGDFKQASEQASSVIDASYYAPHLAQAPMEPPAATAKVSADSAEIWACVQSPQSARQQVANALQLPLEAVTINVTLLGGGFGRKAKPDFVVEAALLAKAAGRPVKVIWRREDDIKHGYYHTVSAQRLSATLDESKKVTGWYHKSVFPPIGSTFNPDANKPSDGELDLGLIDTPFAVPNLQMERGEAEAHVRIGWLRSVANVYHAFATQSFVAELAHQTNTDHKAFLLNLIGPDRHIDFSQSNAKYSNYGDDLSDYPVDTARLKHVVEQVTQMADWDNRAQQGRFLGLAAHRSFLSYAAAVIEVKINDRGEWTIPNAYIVLDAGTVVNPDHVKAQCEGGLIYGISCAIGQITALNGEVTQSNFHNYQVARMPQTPVNIDVKIIQSDALPGGVGEPPTPPAAAALANALFAATGQRFRNLPIPLNINTA